MKKMAFTLLALSITVAACNQNNKAPAIDKRICGRWMILSNIRSNEERYWFKKDGTFIDELFASMSSISTKMNLPKPKNWHVTGNQLVLEYDFNHYIFHLFKIPVPF